MTPSSLPCKVAILAGLPYLQVPPQVRHINDPLRYLSHNLKVSASTLPTQSLGPFSTGFVEAVSKAPRHSIGGVSWATLYGVQWIPYWPVINSLYPGQVKMLTVVGSVAKAFAAYEEGWRNIAIEKAATDCLSATGTIYDRWDSLKAPTGLFGFALRCIKQQLCDTSPHSYILNLGAVTSNPSDIIRALVSKVWETEPPAKWVDADWYPLKSDLVLPGDIVAEAQAMEAWHDL